MSSQSPAPFTNPVIYLDYNATTPIDKAVADAMWPYLTTHFGNAGSEHFYGIEPKLALSLARRRVADLLAVEDDSTIIFNSGSTESINHIIRVSAFKQRQKGYGDHIITTQIEHPAVLETVRYLQRAPHNFRVTYLKPDKYGMIQPSALKKALTPRTILVSIMHSNNEIGTINPIKYLCAQTKQFNRNILFHSDTSQSIGKVPVYPQKWRIDFVTIAGHKIYAPKGIGAMYCNPEVRRCMPDDSSDTQSYNLLYGAKQEFGYRPGTVNIAYCVGLGKAAAMCQVALTSDHMATIRYLRDLLYEEIISNIPPQYHDKIRVNGHPYIRLPNTLSISFGFLRNTEITKRIFKYVACSTGAACHSGDVKLSYVLEACGVSINYGMGTLRISVGRYTTEKDVMLSAKVIASVVSELYSKQFSRL
eukprot:CAMPEP_0202692058 /NCGR_PEP_ID=MMETSP1385-20130828/6549_1 /ASSEMBLY_ACC=CAM_ASM_000861 /TAXON_ID=933848 /ORGANISM="Elphidium margaritaceum" /LENGTH=418 /DNA_ID=CAMNT_0049347531 /DNA_START=98 /DNA_END=1354 /DNA_ORIENTATION=-